MNKGNEPYETYAKGRSEETGQLQKQAKLLNPSTRRLFEYAGITEGMKVLEVGSGGGDVALLIADLIGPSGTVVGVDINPAVLQIARDRVHSVGLTNVSFVEGDICSITLDNDFDAIVGRTVLTYFSDPSAVLRKLATHLHSGGIVAFQEFDLTSPAIAIPPSRLHEQVHYWMKEALCCVGLDIHLGLRLYKIFLDAGLPAPHMGGESFVIGVPDGIGYDYVASNLRSMLPLLLKFGIATAEEVEIDTFAERYRDEIVSQHSVVRTGGDIIYAWVRIPRSL